MRKTAFILPILFMVVLQLTCSKEEGPVSPPSPQNEINKGTISGLLMGDGKLVPKRSYAGFAVEIYQAGNLLRIATTNSEGRFEFAELDTGSYEIKSKADFGYENIAYASDIFFVSDTFLIERDLVFDSIKYDFSSIKVGNSYTYLARDIWACVFGTDTLESIIEISITASMFRGDTTLFFFSGTQDYTYLGSSICFWTPPDSHYVLSGYFKDFNNQVSCIINSEGGEALSRCFRGFHIYDGSDEMKQFLGVIYVPIEIEYGIPFEVKGEYYETLYMNYYFPQNGSTDKKYHFSHQLGTVYTRRWGYWGNTGAGGPEITLIDFDF